MEDQDIANFLNLNEKGSDTIVFHIGSHSIKFGLSTQLQPFIIPNCIAFRKRNIDKSNANISQMDTQILDPSESFNESCDFIKRDLLKKLSRLERINRNKSIKKENELTNMKKYDESNSKSLVSEKKNSEMPLGFTANFKKAYSISLDLNEDILDNNFRWVYNKLPDKNSEDFSNYIVGREVQNIPDEHNYVIHYPIRYGLFNPNLQPQTVVDDLEKILLFCLVDILQIDRKYLSRYNAVLIIPDIHSKIQVKKLLNLFFRRLNFRNIFLHNESVLTTFGSALQVACVVDIGATKTNVCCIEDGMIIKESIIRKHIGGDDINRFLWILLQSKDFHGFYFPSDQLNFNLEYHRRIIEKLKESDLEYPDLNNPSSSFSQKNSKIWLHAKNEETRVFNISLSEACFIPGLVYFYPNILDTIRNIHIPVVDIMNDVTGEVYTDPEDIMEDLINNISHRKDQINSNIKENNHDKDEKSVNNSYIEKSNNKINVLINLSPKKSKNLNYDDSNSISQTKSIQGSDDIDDVTSRKYNNTYNNLEYMYNILPIEELVCKSIMSIPNPELRKRMANTIILAGGSTKMKGFVDFFEDKLIDKFTEEDSQIERVEVVNLPMFDNKTLTWIGGTIIPKLESSKEMWISREKWTCDLFEDAKESNKLDFLENLKEKESDKNNQNMNTSDNMNNSMDFQNGNHQNADDIGSKMDIDDEVDNKEKQPMTNQIQDSKLRKKKEKLLRGGVTTIREKGAFIWK